MRDKLANISRRCGIPAATEPKQFECADGKRPDVTFYLCDQMPLTIDLHINNPACKSHANQADPTADSRRKKDKKYKSTVEGSSHEWTSVGFETFGAFSADADRLAVKLASASAGIMTRKEIAQEVSVIIQRGNAAILASTLAQDRRRDRL